MRQRARILVSAAGIALLPRLALAHTETGAAAGIRVRVSAPSRAGITSSRWSRSGLWGAQLGAARDLDPPGDVPHDDGLRRLPRPRRNAACRASRSESPSRRSSSASRWLPSGNRRSPLAMAIVGRLRGLSRLRARKRARPGHLRPRLQPRLRRGHRLPPRRRDLSSDCFTRDAPAGAIVRAAGSLRGRRRRVLSLAGGDTHDASSAHLVSTGVGPFYDGAAHFFVSFEEILPVLALSLFAGLEGPGRRTSARRSPASRVDRRGRRRAPPPSAGAPALGTTLLLLATGALLAWDRAIPPRPVWPSWRASSGVWAGFWNGRAMAFAGAGRRRNARRRDRGAPARDPRGRARDRPSHRLAAHRRARRGKLDCGARDPGARLEPPKGNAGDRTAPIARPAETPGAPRAGRSALTRAGIRVAIVAAVLSAAAVPLSPRRPTSSFSRTATGSPARSSPTTRAA